MFKKDPFSRMVVDGGGAMGTARPSSASRGGGGADRLAGRSEGLSSWIVLFTGGCLLGSALMTTTAYLTYYYYYLHHRRDDDDDDNNNNQAKDSSPNVLPSSTTAGSPPAANRSGTKEEGPCFHHLNIVSTADFFQAGLQQLWPTLRTGLNEQVRTTLENLLPTVLPTTLSSSLRVTQVDLGSQPPQIHHLQVHDRQPLLSSSSSSSPAEPSYYKIPLAMEMTWDAQDVSIQFQASLWGSLGIQSLHLHGHLSVICQPVTAQVGCGVGGIQAIQLAFLQTPTLTLGYTGWAKLVELSFVDKALQDAWAASLGPTLVLPQRTLIPLDNSSFRPLTGPELYVPPVGVLRVTLLHGQGFGPEKKRWGRSSDIPDVYCLLTLGQHTVRSTTSYNLVSPHWSGSVGEKKGGAAAAAASSSNVFDLILSEPDQLLTIQVMDEDSGTLDRDDPLGQVQLSMREFLMMGQRTITVPVLSSGARPPTPTPTGATLTLSCDLCPLVADWTSLDRTWRQSHEKAQKPNKEEKNQPPDATNHTVAGYLTVLLTRAQNVPLSPTEAYTRVEVRVGSGPASGRETTRTVAPAPGVDARNPVYQAVFAWPLTPALLQILAKEPIVFMLWHQKTSSDNPVLLGETAVTLQDLRQAPEGEWHQSQRPVGDQGASLDLSIILRGIRVPDHKDGDVTLTAAAAALSKATSAAAQAAAAATFQLTSAVVDTASAATSKVTAFSTNNNNNNATDEATEASTIGTDAGHSVATEEPPQDDMVVATEAAVHPSFRLTVVKGRGFKIQRRRLLKADIPDCYCQVQVGSSKSPSAPPVWKTSTIRDNVAPVWNESKEFTLPESGNNTVIHVDVFDEDKVKRGDFLGSAELKVKDLLLAGGIKELPLRVKGTNSGAFITLRGDLQPMPVV